MAEQTPEELAAAQRRESIKRMEESVPTPTQQEIDDVRTCVVPGKRRAAVKEQSEQKKAVEAEATPSSASYQTRSMKPKESE